MLWISHLNDFYEIGSQKFVDSNSYQYDKFDNELMVKNIYLHRY